MQSWFETREDALAGSEAPEEIRRTLSLITVPYISFDGSDSLGQLVIHQALADEVKELFAQLHTIRFPIHSIIPIAAFDWNDDASMEANNSSAFNYRRIIGTDQLSNHSYGTAIDINPMQNPYFARDGKVYPVGAHLDPSAPGTLTADCEVVRVFKERGWRWLGEREENPDYQHFDKLLGQ